MPEHNRSLSYFFRCTALLIILSFDACYQNPVARQTEIVRLDPAIDNIVSLNAALDLLAEGFQLTEGPVWDHDGFLWFSDLGGDVIYKWTPFVGVPIEILKWLPDGLSKRLTNRLLSEFRLQNDHAGRTSFGYSVPNGLTLDKEGRLTICEHGNRRISRLEKDGRLTVLADRYEGHRLNSPNDLTYRSDGRLYFTDPPYGLPNSFDDPRKKLPYSGVFSLYNGALRLISTDLSDPNGLAFSPDEKHLYVTSSDIKNKVVMRYAVNADGTLSKGMVFHDMTSESGEGVLDGMKVDQQGNLYVTGPGGLWIISSSGKHLGTIKGPQRPANVAWGDQDGKTLYLTAQTGLYRIRLNIPGIRP